MPGRVSFNNCFYLRFFIFLPSVDLRLLAYTPIQSSPIVWVGVVCFIFYFYVLSVIVVLIVLRVRRRLPCTAFLRPMYPWPLK